MTQEGWLALIGLVLTNAATMLGLVLKFRGERGAQTIEAKKIDIQAKQVDVQAADTEADNEAVLRRDLFRMVETLRRALEEQKAEHTKAVETLQTRMGAQEQAHSDQQAQTQAENLQLNRRITTLSQEVMETRTKLEQVLNREYSYFRYLTTLDRKGSEMFTTEYRLILEAAEHEFSRPKWPQFAQTPIPDSPAGDPSKGDKPT